VESGEAQLARVRAATPHPADPPGPAADLPTQLAHLRAILELLEYYAYYRRGNLHADVAAAVGTPERPGRPDVADRPCGGGADPRGTDPDGLGDGADPPDAAQTPPHDVGHIAILRVTSNPVASLRSLALSLVPRRPATSSVTPVCT